MKLMTRQQRRQIERIDKKLADKRSKLNDEFLAEAERVEKFGWFVSGGSYDYKRDKNYHSIYATNSLHRTKSKY